MVSTYLTSLLVSPCYLSIGFGTRTLVPEQKPNFTNRWLQRCPHPITSDHLPHGMSGPKGPGCSIRDGAGNRCVCLVDRQSHRRRSCHQWWKRWPELPGSPTVLWMHDALRGGAAGLAVVLPGPEAEDQNSDLILTPMLPVSKKSRTSWKGIRPTTNSTAATPSAQARRAEAWHSGHITTSMSRSKSLLRI